MVGVIHILLALWMQQEVCMSCRLVKKVPVMRSAAEQSSEGL